MFPYEKHFLKAIAMNSTLLSPAQSAEEFNRKYPVGSTVTITYYGVDRKTTIENKAVVIDGHTAVVKVSGLLERLPIQKIK